MRRPGASARMPSTIGAQEAGAVLEAAAVAARPVVAAEELVAEVAVAVLHVHELEPGPLREHGGPHVVVGQAVEVLVGQDPHAAGEAPVEDRVGEGDERLRPVPGARARVAAGVGDLQAHHEVVRGALAEARLVGRDEVVAQARQRLPGRGVDHELAGVGAAVVAHGGRLAAPDELGAGEAEVPASGGASARWGGRPPCRPSPPSAGCRSGCPRAGRRPRAGGRRGSRRASRARRRRRAGCRPPRGAGGRPRGSGGSRRAPSLDQPCIPVSSRIPSASVIPRDSDLPPLVIPRDSVWPGPEGSAGCGPLVARHDRAPRGDKKKNGPGTGTGLRG